MDIISNSQAWLIVGFLMLVIEMFSLSFFAIFFALGALLTAALTYFGVLPSVTWQVVIFCVTSILSLIFLRKFIKKTFSKPKGGKEYSEFIGDPVRVTKAIPANGRGKVYYRGTEWDAISEDGQPIDQEATVTIIRMDGIIAIVKS
jgi:Membrane protein implicated in regulation of membrane protease activity